MSMLSAQCDELRSMAESVGLEVPQAATLMMEAADTILSLRDRAQDLQAENAKLQETLQRRTEQFGGMTEMWVERGVENARLRELAKGLYEFAYAEYPRAVEAGFADDLRELGVEVEECTTR